MIYDAAVCNKATSASCITEQDHMPPTYSHFRGEIFSTCFRLVSNSKPVCRGCNGRWQRHPSTLSQPINKRNDTFAHTQTAQARVIQMNRQTLLCIGGQYFAWLTHLSDFCSRKMHRQTKYPLHTEVGWAERHVVLAVFMWRRCMCPIVLNI